MCILCRLLERAKDEDFSAINQVFIRAINIKQKGKKVIKFRVNLFISCLIRGIFNYSWSFPFPLIHTEYFFPRVSFVNNC